MRFLDQFSVLLLDMNGTFMFDCDRLGPTEDYFATYVRLGGRGLDQGSVLKIVNVVVDVLGAAYAAPERVDDFPSVAEVLLEQGNRLERDELSIIENVIATHELGSVPKAHCEFLSAIAGTHSLGLVSNLWSHPAQWFAALDDLGILPLFKTIVFSSEGRSIKPSRLLFDRALAAFPEKSSVLFIGDSLERDIVPAKALGLSTAWIAPSGSQSAAADVVVQSLPELVEVTS